jgi:hypothetical protein
MLQQRIRGCFFYLGQSLHFSGNREERQNQNGWWVYGEH